MKNLKRLLAVAALAVASISAEDWRKVAFIGDAQVKSISGLVELVSTNKDRILHEGETAIVGQTLRIWRGAEVVLQMKNSQSLVRAKGPVLLRLAPESEAYDRAAVTGTEEQAGFVVRAVHGNAKYQDGAYWRPLRTGMSIPEGTKVRPGHDSIVDLYHPKTRTAYRVTDHTRQTAMIANPAGEEQGGPTVLAAKAP